jgi:transcriptional regulator with XRE-family HTH domain
MIRVRLREAMESYASRTGEKLTYERLSSLSGISRAALESLAGRQSYNPTLDVIDKLCKALGSTPAELLERLPTSHAEDNARNEDSHE